MASEAEVICGQLANAVKAMMDPLTPSQIRLEAFTNCERFKETSDPGLGIQCSILLSGNSDPIIRHFGLKLLEDVIKLKWNDMSPEQKLFVKENAMMIIDNGIVDLVKDPLHVKDAIARSVVEIAKREWPQQWPSFLAELEALSAKGDAQAELVMFVMLRLVEDVAVLQTLEQTQRRKEIYQALMAAMETIFKFLLTLLERHYQAYITNAVDQIKLRHSKVCHSVLDTFTAFVEWAPMQHIMANNHYLVRCLCHLLRDDRLQIYAAECLLAIVSWKIGKLTDRVHLLVLFQSDMISPLFEAVEAANLKTMQGEDDAHYLFLKRTVQILVELGLQVVALWSAKETNCQRPENFEIYLNALLAFTYHNSQMVNYLANELWAKFFRHPDIFKDSETFQSFVPKWVEAAMKKSVRSGHPSKEDHPSCVYSRMDFETDEEFSSFFGRYRLVMTDILKLISATNPTIPYRYCDQWLRNVLSRPEAMRPVTKTSPVYLELEAIQWALEAVMSRLSTQEELAPILAPALDLLKLALDFPTEDPLLTSVLLSSISSLFVVVSVTPAALNPTLTRIFKCITFTKNNPVGSEAPMPQEVKALRRHGCSLLVKIASKYPQSLLPVFDYLRHTIIDELYVKSKALYKMEFATLVEALILVSNEYENYDHQTAFIESLSRPVVDKLKAMEAVISTPEAFMAFIGLDGTKDCSNNRGEVSFCLNFILAIVRRSSTPSDVLKCKNGGFVVETTTSGGTEAGATLRSPAGNLGCHVLTTLLKLTKTFIDLFKARQNPAFSKIFDMLAVEKLTVLGGQSLTLEADNKSDNGEPAAAQLQKTNDDLTRKLQMFIYEQFENCTHILALYCSTFGHQFFKQPGLASGLVTSVYAGIEAVPDYRIRSIIRIFTKALINKCPKMCYGQVLAPVLTQLCPYMMNRLTSKWKQLIEARESPTFDEDNTDSQEVLDDVIGRHLTREYLDVVKAILTSGGGSDLNGLSASSESLNKGKCGLHLTELGTLVMQHDSLGQVVTMTLLRALIWPDSQASARASALMEVILPILASSDQMSSADAAHVMFTILQALHTMGQHEMNGIALTSLCVQAYEQLRPKHPSVADVLAQVPGINPEELKRFDARVLNSGKENGGKEVKASDRILKTMFKKLIGQFVGKDLAQRFKKEIVIKNLPSLQLLKPRLKTPSLDEKNEELGIANLFATNPSPAKNNPPQQQQTYAML